jgi:hypothetical protein
LFDKIYCNVFVARRVGDPGQSKEIVRRAKTRRATGGREKAKARRRERAAVENGEHNFVQVEPELSQQCLGAAKKVQGENKEPKGV